MVCYNMLYAQAPGQMRARLHEGGRERALAPLVLPHGEQHGQRLALRTHEQRRTRPREQRLRGSEPLVWNNA